MTRQMLVHNPVGYPPKVAGKALAPRLDTLNGRTVYRLRAGSFATGAEADAFCNAFKSAGGQCYRATK